MFHVEHKNKEINNNKIVRYYFPGNKISMFHVEHIKKSIKLYKKQKIYIKTYNYVNRRITSINRYD